MIDTKFLRLSLLFYDSNHKDMIPTMILEDYDVKLRTFEKGDLVFSENDIPKSYFQIKTGSVKMINLSEDGKEFVQRYFLRWRCFWRATTLWGFQISC